MSNWQHEQIANLFNLPFIELIYQAHTVHRQQFKSNEIELCTLVSIKTGGCPEDCGYCSQSAHYQTHLKKEKLWELEAIIDHAKKAKMDGATRVCLGAAWRNPPKRDFPRVLAAISAIKNLGMETCVTLGMLTEEQANELKAAGLDYYNHNLDTSPNYYPHVVSTRTYQDRLDTLTHVREAGIHVCSGGIIGMGESRKDRADLILTLATLPKPPQSIPINRLIPIPGTPLAKVTPIDDFEFIRTIAVTRICVPSAIIRLSAGREQMTDEAQTLCFMAGANSMWLGEKLLTVNNADQHQDLSLLNKLGMKQVSLLPLC